MFKKANQKMSNFFKLWWGVKDDASKITPKKAIEIQKQSYLNSMEGLEKSCTPPYIKIAEQLKSDKKQVFEAAVFYLCVIAANEPKYKQQVLDILNSYAAENKSNDERISFIREQEKQL